MSRSLVKLSRRILLVAIIAAFAVAIPVPIWAPPVVVYVHVPLVVFLAVCAMGKALIDTLFYPHYR